MMRYIDVIGLFTLLFAFLTMLGLAWLTGRDSKTIEIITCSTAGCLIAGVCVIFALLIINAIQSLSQ